MSRNALGLCGAEGSGLAAPRLCAWNLLSDQRRKSGRVTARSSGSCCLGPTHLPSSQRPGPGSKLLPRERERREGDRTSYPWSPISVIFPSSPRLGLSCPSREGVPVFPRMGGASPGSPQAAPLPPTRPAKSSFLPLR